MSLAHVLLLLALGPASLLAFALSPSATVLNQLAALGGWGLAALMLAPAATRGRLARPAAALGALAVVAAAALASWLWRGLPTSLAVPPMAVMAAAAVLIVVGAAAADAGEDLLRPMAVALVVVGVANTVIALLQVFAPDLPDGLLVAKSGLAGRAVGNLRQPNHLSTIALWSTVAVVPLLEARRLPRALAAVLFAAFVFSIELSGSRTGMVGIVVLALWGVLDRRLSRFARLLLVCAPLIYGLGWIGMSWWAAAQQHTFGAAARLGESDISGSRYGIWSNTLALIRMHPLAGVGFGEFNFAWSLTPFPQRPTAFFDHTHNIVLQLLVELGLPLGLLAIALLAVALWQAWRRVLQVPGDQGATWRAAFVMVLLMAIHSQLEYPLWYAYFLLPTAFLWGSCLGAPGRAADAGAESPSAAARFGPVLAGTAMVAASAVAFQQYLAISRIFEPGEDVRPLELRIEQGERSAFYGYHAYYADATVADSPADAWPAFRVAPHFLLDTRLMTAWAQGFAERGDLERARHVAQRLREFRRHEADSFFAPCQGAAAGAERPFQCDPPSRPIDWREFRDPALYTR